MLFFCLFCLLSESESAPLLLMPAMSATGSSRFAKASAVNSSMLLIKIFRGLSILAKPLDVCLDRQWRSFFQTSFSPLIAKNSTCRAHSVFDADKLSVACLFAHVVGCTYLDSIYVASPDAGICVNK